MRDQSLQPSQIIFPVALDVPVDEAVQEGAGVPRVPWGWLELFVAVQVLWGVLLFVPGSQGYRFYIRAFPFVSSLVALAACMRRVAAGADPGTKEALAVANRAYEERFGYLFLTCATGKNAATILEELERRMQNDPATERRVAIDEQRKITRLRLEKLLRS